MNTVKKDSKQPTYSNFEEVQSVAKNIFNDVVHSVLGVARREEDLDAEDWLRLERKCRKLADYALKQRRALARVKK